MSTRTKLGAFALVLAAALGGGAALGVAVGPIDVGGADHPMAPASPSPDHDEHGQ